jgi:hypothetical protein
MPDFNRENYLNDDGLIDDTRLSHDLIQMLAFMSEVLVSGGWNLSLSYGPASDKVIEHLTSIYGSPDDGQDNGGGYSEWNPDLDNPNVTTDSFGMIKIE